MLDNNWVRYLIGKLPHVHRLKEKIRFYEENLFVPPGHFYSPLVDTGEIKARQNRIFDLNKPLIAIDLNASAQWELLEQFKQYYQQLAFPENQAKGKRYWYNNSYFSYSDVIFLFSVILHFQPKRIIEIGSGFSSAAMLDINERFFQNGMDITFIEPYPENLKKLVLPGDRFTLIEKKVQDVPVSVFQSLHANDLLFIDSTHVAKTNSDVLFELFEILPSLNKGVKIHFHDIFFPFEYPKDWVLDNKRNWNEIYLLQAFLMYNQTFRILAFNTFLETTNPKWFEEHMPLCLKNTGGSCWLEKLT